MATVEKITGSICLCLLLLLASAPAIRAGELIVVLKSREVEPYEIALKSLKQTLKGKTYDLTIEEHVLQNDTKARNGLVGDIRRKNPRLIVTLGSWLLKKRPTVPQPRHLVAIRASVSLPGG